jgi:hypothetical protein
VGDGALAARFETLFGALGAEQVRLRLATVH